MDMKQIPFEGILGGPGLLPGIVIQNTPDPGQPVRGAVKVWLPHIHGSEEPLPSTLPEATVLQLWGGIVSLGIIAMPPLRSSVICGFLLGDQEKPVVIGPYFGAEGLPTEAQAAQQTQPESVLTLEHPTGWLIKLDFVESRLEMRHPTLNSIVLDTEGVKISKAGETASARLIHEFGVDSFTGSPLGEATQGATAAIKVSQAPQ